jgi:hypothetical protein
MSYPQKSSLYQHFSLWAQVSWVTIWSFNFCGRLCPEEWNSWISWLDVIFEGVVFQCLKYLPHWLPLCLLEWGKTLAAKVTVCFFLLTFSGNTLFPHETQSETGLQLGAWLKW